MLSSMASRRLRNCFKPIPDEEGTEMAWWASRIRRPCRASNRSPMRRGLKFKNHQTALARTYRFKPIPDEEGTEIRWARKWDSPRVSFKPIPDEERTEIPNGSICLFSLYVLQTDPR